MSKLTFDSYLTFLKYAVRNITLVNCIILLYRYVQINTTFFMNILVYVINLKYVQKTIVTLDIKYDNKK